MARLAGVDLPAKKRTEIGLTYIYGIGRTRSKSLCHRAGVNPDKKVADLTEDGKYSAHFEHTVAITAEGPWVLTRP